MGVGSRGNPVHFLAMARARRATDDKFLRNTATFFTKVRLCMRGRELNGLAEPQGGLVAVAQGEVWGAVWVVFAEGIW